MAKSKGLSSSLKITLGVAGALMLLGLILWYFGAFGSLYDSWARGRYAKATGQQSILKHNEQGFSSPATKTSWFGSPSVKNNKSVKSLNKEWREWEVASRESDEKSIKFASNTKKEGELAYKANTFSHYYQTYLEATIQNLKDDLEEYNGMEVKVLRDRRKTELSAESKKKDKSRRETTVDCLLKSDKAAWRVLDAETNEELPFRLKASQLQIQGTLSTYALNKGSASSLSWVDFEEKNGSKAEIIPNDPGHDIKVPKRWDMTHDPDLPGPKDVGAIPAPSTKEKERAKKDRDKLKSKRYEMGAQEYQVTSEWLNTGKECSYLPPIEPTTDADRSTQNHSGFVKNALRKNGKANRGKNKSLFR